MSALHELTNFYAGEGARATYERHSHTDLADSARLRVGHPTIYLAFRKSGESGPAKMRLADRNVRAT